MSNEPAEFPELQKLARRVLETPEARLAVLPDPVLSDALESLNDLERWHRLNAELAAAASARLLNAWRTRP